jgi:hypothetical protein
MKQQVCIRKLILIALCAGVAYFLLLYKDHGELGQKEGWAALQGIELEYRDKKFVDAPMLLTNISKSHFTIIGLPTDDRQAPYVWMIINDDPYVAPRVMPPTLHYHVQCEYVNDLKKRYGISSDNPNAVITLLTLTCKK